MATETQVVFLKALPLSSEPSLDNLTTVADSLPSEGQEDVFAKPPDRGERPACFRSTVQEILFVLAATMAVAMPSILQGCTIVISSFVGKDLRMSTAEITWMTASSALTSGSFLLFFGKIADMFGRRMLFISSLLLFSVISLATGFSRNPLTLDVLNGLLGLVSACAIPAVQGILGNIYQEPSRRKNYVFASFSAGNPLGFVFGSIFSGIATQIFNWRASFWLLAIIYIFVTILAFITIPPDDSDKLLLTKDSFKHVDVVGVLLTIGGIGLFTTALSTGADAPQGWKTPYIIAFMVVGIVLIAVFIWWENRYPYPLMPMSIWLDKDFSLLMIIILLGFLAFPAMSFFIALYFQNLLHDSALMTAVHMLPMAVSGIIVNIVAGLILHKISNKILVAVGATAYTIAFLLIAVQRSGASYWAFTFPALTLVVIGADMEFNVANMYVISSLPLSQQSIAGSIFQAVTKLAVALGIGICTAIFRAVSRNPVKSGYYKNDPYEPYAACFWFAMICTFISLLLVPFLKIKTQGHKQ